MPDRPVPGPASSVVPGPRAVTPAATRVDAALAYLDGLDDRPVADHVAAYDAVHRGLQDALATLDEA